MVIRVKKDFLKKYIIGLVLVALLCLGSLYLNKKDATKETSDTKFYDEYTAYNKKKNSSDKEYPSVDIAKKNLYYYITDSEIEELFNNGTGVLYLGFPTCPWCRNIVSVLNEAGEEYGIDKINYYNIKTIRSSFTFDDDNKLIKTDGNEIYTFLLEKLDKFLEDYSVTDNKGKAVKTGEKRIYAPSVVFIKEGVVKKVVEGTVDSQKDPYILLNEEERKELKDKYLEGFNTLADLCDEKC